MSIVTEPPAGIADQKVLQQFSDSLLLERGLSRNTLSAYLSDLKQFGRWLESADTPVFDVSRSDILDYLSERLSDGKSSRSSARALSTLKRFYAFLLRERLIESDPTLLVSAPKIGRVERLLDSPDAKTDLGCRDRTMLELLYACGLRVSELVTIELDQINLGQGVVRVWGKGNKERMIPMGDSAVEWVSRYVKGARLNLLEAAKTQSNSVFLSRRGQAMTRQTFWYAIKRYAAHAQIKGSVSPHTVRHAFATHLVNHDADLRVVQLLLGHSDLSTTQIYTHVATTRMKGLHSKHHPRG